MSQGTQLRQHLQQPGTLVLPGVYDCISAQIVAQMEFVAAFTSGFGIAATTLGRPDYGFVTATEMLDSVGRIAQSVDIPIVADLDTGYGNPLNVIRTITDTVRLGLAGCILEDQEWPKKCGHFSGKRVIPTAEHVQKLKAAVHARGDNDLIIIARTDARAPLGLAAAIERGRAYAEAGADVIFIEAPQSLEELRAIAQALPHIPLFANMIEGGKTPVLTGPQLQQLGYKIVVYPLAGLFSATQALLNCYRHLRQHQTTVGYQEMVDFPAFEHLINLEHYRQLEQKFRASP